MIKGLLGKRVTQDVLLVLSVLALVSWQHLALDRPYVLIRWAQGVPESDRTRLEQSFGLSNPLPHEDDPRTRRYVIADSSGTNLRAIVTHPAVEDTHNIDRVRYRLDSEPDFALTRLWRSVPVSVAIAALLAALLFGRPASARMVDGHPGTGAWTARASHRLAAAYPLAIIAALSVGVGYDNLMNDHAGYLAMARQIMFGELPIRDFLDHGTFLHVLISALLQWAFGHRLLAEMIWCSAVIVVGCWVTFHLTASATRSYAMGFLLTLSCALTPIRPYSYPKLLVYPVAIFLLWRHVRDASSRNLALLGLWGSVALMLRFDHGVAIAFAGAATVGAFHAFASIRESLRRVGLFIMWFLVGLGPFLVYLALFGGIAEHVMSVLQFGRRALVQSDPFTLYSLRLNASAGPPDVGVAFLHDAYVLLTLVALGVVAWRLFQEARTRRRTVLTFELLGVLAIWMTSAPMLLRDNFGARFSDVTPMPAVLAAVLLAVYRDAVGSSATIGRERGWPGVLAEPLLAVALTGLLLVPTVTMWGGLPAIADRYGRAFRNAGEVYRDFAQSPPDKVIHGYHGLLRYARECTMPTDRLLVTWFAPEIYFAANRRFAGNQWVYVDYQNSPEQQRTVTRTILGQSVPLVFARPNDSMFEGVWPVLAEHVDRAYRQVGMLDGTLVYAKRDQPSVPSPSFPDLPCFAAVGE